MFSESDSEPLSSHQAHPLHMPAAAGTVGCCPSKLSFMRSPSSSSIRCSTAPRSRSVAASVLPSSLSLSASDVCTSSSAVFRNSFTTLRIASFNSALSANSLT